MRRLAVALIALVTLCGCGSNDPDAARESNDDIALQNARLVRDAVVAFASENAGWYAADVDSTVSLWDLTLIDYLPQGQRVQNAFTLERTEPHNGDAASPGEIGYESRGTNGRVYGYRLSVRGAEEVLARFSNIPKLEQRVIANCELARLAAERYAAEHDGEYPWDILHTPAYKKLLPNGSLLNPFTRLYNEPHDGPANDPGEIGYVSTRVDGHAVGFTISGWGETAEIYRHTK